MSGPVLAAADWGTSRFRLWLLGPAGELLGERQGAEGLEAAAAAGFGAVLEGHLAALGAAPDLPALLCGMAGARQGWREAPYLPLPAALADLAAHAVAVPGIARPVRILPGLAQTDPPDVMRGEETQLLGLGLRDGTACLPGTHCKWARMEAGRVTAFTTFPTGELFALLARHSILRHTIAGAPGPEAPEAEFRAGVAEGLADPARLPARLFGIRAAGLLRGLAPDAAAARLSGLLVGAEIAAARAEHGGGPVHLVAAGPLGPLYAAALAAAGLTPVPRDAEAAVRRGLWLAGQGLAARAGA